MMDLLGQKATFRMFGSPESAQPLMTSKKLEKLLPWLEHFVKPHAKIGFEIY